MGQHFRTSDVGVTNAMNQHLRGVGLASVVCGFVVVTYYVPLISWCFKAFLGKRFNTRYHSFCLLLFLTVSLPFNYGATPGPLPRRGGGSVWSSYGKHGPQSS
jgi:hypothetical protein